jgi:hypothetical protein
MYAPGHGCEALRGYTRQLRRTPLALKCRTAGEEQTCSLGLIVATASHAASAFCANHHIGGALAAARHPDCVLSPRCGRESTHAHRLLNVLLRYDLAGDGRTTHVELGPLLRSINSRRLSGIQN